METKKKRSGLENALILLGVLICNPITLLMVFGVLPHKTAEHNPSEAVVTAVCELEQNSIYVLQLQSDDYSGEFSVIAKDGLYQKGDTVAVAVDEHRHHAELYDVDNKDAWLFAIPFAY